MRGHVTTIDVGQTVGTVNEYTCGNVLYHTLLQHLDPQRIAALIRLVARSTRSS
jgi:hypothetical protein